MDSTIPIAIGDKHGEETDYRENLLVNYTLVSKQIKNGQGYIISHPGLSSFGTANGIDRGGFFNSRQNNHLRISGSSLVSVSSEGVVDNIGAIPGAGHAIMDNSFETQGILADGRFFLYDGVTLSEVVDPDLGAPIDFKWINGVYFFTDGEFLFHTTATSEFNLQPQVFATSEFSPDRTYGLLKNEQNQIIALNRYSIEWFRDTGEGVDNGVEQFRFERIQGKAVKIGIVGTNCKVEVSGKMYILGGRKTEDVSIHYVAGGQSVSIATREIDKVISQYSESELRSAVMETRTQFGDRFIIVRLPNETLLYNLTVASKHGNATSWTIVKTGVNDGAPWRGRNGVFDPRISEWVYGDSQDGRLGILDELSSAQYGEQMEGIFYTPIMPIETASINELEIDTIPGFYDGPVSVFISMSADGVGYSPEKSFLYSEYLNYNTRYIARNIGYIRDNFSLKFRTVTSAKTVFGGLRINYD